MIRRRPEEHEEGTDRWLVSYADFITLLFAFFTILYATSEQNVEKSKYFEESIKKYLIKFGAFGASGPETKAGQKFNTTISPPLKTFPNHKDEVGKKHKQVEAILEDSLTKEELEKMIADISDDAIGVRISLKADQVFPKGSAKFREDSLETLNKLAEVLKTSNKRVFVEGHTGRSKFKSAAYPSNWELAAARASAIIRYYTKLHDIKESRFIALSYGNTQPAYSSEDVGSNARIDFLLLTQDLPF